MKSVGSHRASGRGREENSHNLQLFKAYLLQIKGDFLCKTSIAKDNLTNIQLIDNIIFNLSGMLFYCYFIIHTINNSEQITFSCISCSTTITPILMPSAEKWAKH